MKATRALVLLSLALCLVACVHDTPYELARVGRTELVRGLSRQHTNVVVFAERQDAAGVHVYLGFDEGTHTTRHAALLVRPDGSVWQETTRSDCELDWEPAR